MAAVARFRAAVGVAVCGARLPLSLTEEARRAAARRAVLARLGAEAVGVQPVLCVFVVGGALFCGVGRGLSCLSRCLWLGSDGRGAKHCKSARVGAAPSYLPAPTQQLHRPRSPWPARRTPRARAAPRRASAQSRSGRRRGTRAAASRQRTARSGSPRAAAARSARRPGGAQRGRGSTRAARAAGRGRPGCDV